MLHLQNKSEDTLNSYVPGDCNLGTEEVKRRFKIGYIGLVASVLLIVALYLFNAPRIWKLLLFIPAFYSLSGFIQAKNKFCYFYGFKSVFSVKGIRRLTSVTNPDFQNKDRRKALIIVTMTFLISALATIIYYVVN